VIVVVPLLLAFAAADPPCKAAVLDLAPGEGVSTERARSFTEVITGEVGAHLQCSVLSRAEIRALVSFEVERQLSGCDSGSSCLSEISDALGVDRVVLGTFSRIDSRSVVSLRLVDMRTAEVLRRVTDTFEGDDRDAVKWIAWLARRVSMKNEADAGERPVVDKPRVVERRATLWRSLAWTGVIGGGAVLVIAGGLGAGALGISSSLPGQKSARTVNRAQVESLEEAGPLLAGGANLGLYVGAGLVVIGGALFFAPGEEMVEVNP
jgi:hypothetical protein